MGDDRGFEEWYAANADRLVRSMTVATGDSDGAADAVAEAAARALPKWDSIVDPSAWIYRVALNVVRRRERRRAMETRLLRREQVTARSVSASAVHDLDLWAAVDLLPPRMREVIALRYVGDLTEGQAATALGISEGAVSSALSAARGQLRAALGPSHRLNEGAFDA